MRDDFLARRHAAGAVGNAAYGTRRSAATFREIVFLNRG